MRTGEFKATYLSEMQKYGGKIWYTSIGPEIILVLNKPELLADVLSYKAKFYKKIIHGNMDKEIYGNGICNATGA